LVLAQVNNFEALCGFCDLQEISRALALHAELRHCVGDRIAVELADAIAQDGAIQRVALKAAFTALMTCSADIYQPASQQLFSRLSVLGAGQKTDKDSLFVRVFQQFPRDVGTLAVFFLNHVRLEPGEAIYLAANEPHAYLSGELVEAMASSDNVIRAGLTGKLRDTEVCLQLVCIQTLLAAVTRACVSVISSASLPAESPRLNP
jgi:mannose-6-phosphate isomerase